MMEIFWKINCMVLDIINGQMENPTRETGFKIGCMAKARYHGVMVSFLLLQRADFMRASS